MATWRICCCSRCRTRGLLWPTVLIALGVIFFIGQSNPAYSFSRLWPVILIVAGVVKVLESMVSAEGHMGRSGPWQNPPPTPPQAPPSQP